MSRLISRAEGFEAAYEAFQQVNFAAFDYNTIKESMIQYIKLYFPENFNDYIESSEFIAILELFAYLGELLAYRIDINAHENFLTTAQRKQNVLRLAKLISYNPSRNLPARGLVKLTSVSCSESVIDSEGVDLQNRVIIWNDPNNPRWKEQFILVMNRIMEQNFGTVAPNDRIQVDDVLFELYQLENVPSSLTNGVLNFNVSVSGQTLPMELVPVTLEDTGPVERRPEVNASFSILYGTDGLGDSSDTTGFFVFAKQGTLQSVDSSFDGITPNQTWSVDNTNINEIDTWLNNIDPDTGETLAEWENVDKAHAQNIIFNTNTNRLKVEIESLEDDNVRLVFGDGEFADVPSGTFRFWFRTSINDDIVIPRNAINNVDASLTYLDSDANSQTFTFTYSSIGTMQNSSASEDIEHIRRVAPAVYYSQDRMVNSRDYNTFMLQDPSIVKMRAVNRTFAGESKYITWNDPSDVYRNVKQFGDDLAIYYELYQEAENVSNVDPETFLRGVIEASLVQLEVFLSIALLDSKKITKTFLNAEFAAMQAVLDAMVIGEVVYIEHYEDSGLWWHAATTPVNVNNVIFKVEKVTAQQYTITTYKTRMIAESTDTDFWHTNNGDTTLTYDSMLSNDDEMIVLKANVGADGTVLTSNILFESLSRVALPSGLDSKHKLKIIPNDTNEDGIPDGVDLASLVDREFLIIADGAAILQLTESYVAGYGDLISIENLTQGWTYTINDIIEGTEGDVVSSVSFSGIDNAAPVLNDLLRVKVRDFVYFYRETASSEWTPMVTEPSTLALFAADVEKVALLKDGSGSNPDGNYKRHRGRSDLNFLWTHFTSRYNLVDPATSNIIDMFIIPKAYYSNYKSYLNKVSTIQPDEPTPFELRNTYASLLENKMISDTVVLHPGVFKVLFGSDAIAELRAKFVVVRSSNGKLADNQVKLKMVTIIRNFFDITQWEFGETFYFTELAATIQTELASEIDSVVLVPLQESNVFGDLFQVYAREDELFLPSITVDDIEMVDSFNSTVLKQNR